MTRRILVSAVAVFAVAFASCGGSSSPEAAPTTTATAPTTTKPAGDGAPVPSAGCKAKSPAASADLTKVTLDVDGAERWFLLTAPASTDPVPLVVDYHGLSEGAQVHTQMTGFGTLAKEKGFAVAVPQGLGTPVGWAAATTGDTHGDQKFTAALLDHIEQERCIDTSRVYASGLSNGAFMTSSVACTFSDRFAAVAPVAGLMALKPCPAKRPVPVLTIHGTADPILLFNGGVDGDFLGNVLGGKPAVPKDRPYDIDGPGYPQGVADWAARNGCEPKPNDTKVTDDIIHRVYPCPAGAEVEFYIVIEGGHAWPGSKFSEAAAKFVGNTTMDLDATQVIWDFFQDHQLPA